MAFRVHMISRQLLALGHDVAAAALSFLLAIFLRLGSEAPAYFDRQLFFSLLLFVGVSGAVFLSTGLYRGLWRYASMNDLAAIVKAATLAILVFLPVSFLVTRLEGVPRSSLLINWFVLIFLLGAPRMLYRVYKDRGLAHLLERDRHLRIPALVVGAGDAAEVFIREMARDRNAPYEVLGVIDEKGTRVGRRIHDVAVLGHIDDAADIIRRISAGNRPVQRLIVSKRLERRDMERLLAVAESRGIAIGQLPRLAELHGSSGELAVKPMAIEDLLGRPQATLDRPAMRRLVAGRRVMITGAGGSIGAELARQTAELAPAEIVLFDASEHNLYEIDLELAERHPQLSRIAVIGDVRDPARLDQVMAQARPQLLFHAAALKHVPLVEGNPLEAILTNVIGTRNVAEACRRAGVAEMVLISTDKAINPSNVMGATKRLAESYGQALDIAGRKSGSGPRVITVRFGNVLGSAGSVVPLFQRQLAAGGPLTVTHPEMTRYFMTVREAVELVLQAAALETAAGSAGAGRIYVLDMGEPVRILDLAKQMIRLAGKTPGKDVEIRFTGPRPGEKLREELFHGEETLTPSGHPGLHLAAPRTSNLELLGRSLDDLERLARQRQRDAALALLARLVPEYRAIAGEAPSPRPALDDSAAAS